MSNKLSAYNSEIQPKLRALKETKEALKAYKESNTRLAALQENITAAKEALAFALDQDDNTKQMLTEIKEMSAEIKEAIKAAADGTEYKPKELKAYFGARCDDTVEVTISKGDLFEALNAEIN